MPVTWLPVTICLRTRGCGERSSKYVRCKTSSFFADADTYAGCLFWAKNCAGLWAENVHLKGG